MQKNSKNDLLVSICTITFNHEKYLSEAIESFISQKTDFKYEIIIADDASNDTTKEIIESYDKKYKDLFRIIIRKKNLGMQKNFIDALSQCKGKYIALCEGDDYWTDPFKLQKQVDFLEDNHEFSMCSHAVEVVFEKDWKLDNDTRIKDPIRIAGFEDILDKHFIATNSLIFRNGLIKKWPNWFYKMLSGDIPLELMLAYHGKSYFFSEKMGVKRINAGGITANPERLKFIKKFRADLFYYINQYTKYKHFNILYPKIISTSKSMILNEKKTFNFFLIIKYSLRIISVSIKRYLIKFEKK